MGRYLLRRLLINIPVLISVTIIIFTLTELAPGDVTDFFINPELEMTPADMEQLRIRLGLDAPAPVRYLRWLNQVLHGNLGYRFKNGDDVAWIIGRRLQATLILIGAALLFGTLLGIALGVFTALRQYSLWDFTLTGLSFVGISMPAFISGIFGLYFFSVRLKLFPSGGMWTIGQGRSVGDLLYHLVLPAGTLSLAYIATYMRYTRFSMLEVIRQDYITTARAKGLPEHIVILRHALRNAILPVVTIIGLSIPNLVVGAVFIETIYSWPGMGSLYLDAVLSRDYPLIMGINLVSAVVILTANLLTDIFYSVVDPRIRYDEESSRG
ncbi:MAG: ABC transporter permease [Anaerolineae bacterium]|nr:ABC transporter permease [Anaerolineae bacterium]